MSVMPCPKGDGQCTVGDSAVAVEHGQVFVATREELAERWHVDLADVRPRVRVDAELRALLDAHVEAVQASEEGAALLATPMPMPEKVARHARLVVVECDPCRHLFMAEL